MTANLPTVTATVHASHTTATSKPRYTGILSKANKTKNGTMTGSRGSSDEKTPITAVSILNTNANSGGPGTQNQATMQSTLNRSLISNSDAKSTKKRYKAGETQQNQIAETQTNKTNTSTHGHLNLGNGADYFSLKNAK